METLQILIVFKKRDEQVSGLYTRLFPAMAPFWRIMLQDRTCCDNSSPFQ